MSTISNVQEAREALCNGELFQVGGRFINPRDIVEVDPNGGTNPIFRLEDGRTVQHNRFTPGDVGDYLAAALDYAQRGGAQSEAIKPAFNRIIVGGGIYGIYNRAGTKISALQNDGLGMNADLSAGIGFAPGSNGEIYKHDLDAGTTSTLTDSDSAAKSVLALDTENQKLYWTMADGSNEVRVKELNYDGSGKSQQAGPFSTQYGNPEPNTGALFPDDGLLIVNPDNSTQLVDLNNGTFSAVGIGFSTACTVDKVNGEFLAHENSNSTITRIDKNGNTVGTFSNGVPSYAADLEHNQEDDVLVFADEANQFVQIPNGGGTAKQLFQESGITGDTGLSLGLDLSSV